MVCPASLHALSVEAMLSAHVRSLMLVGGVAEELRFPQRVCLAACVLYHDFFIHHSLQHYEAEDVAIAALFLAGKAEEAPRKLHDVAHMWALHRIAARRVAERLKSGDTARAPLAVVADASVDAASPANAASPSLSPQSAQRGSGDSSVVEEERHRPLSPTDPDVEHERVLRTRILRLEGELLLSSDFNFSLCPAPRLIADLLRQIARRPRPVRAAGEEVTAAEAVAWDVEREVVQRRMETVFCTAMTLLKGGLVSGASLFYTPHAIAVACVFLAAAFHHIDVHEVAERSAFTSAWPPVPPPPPPQKEKGPEETANPTSSPASSASASPFSPLYAESPSSPSVCSPASFGSVSSSSSAVAAPTTAASATATSTSSRSADADPLLPPPPPWYRALLGGSVLEDLSRLLPLIIAGTVPHDSLRPLRELSVAALASLTVPPEKRAEGDLVDLLGVRADYDALLAAKTKEEEERRAIERQRVEEEQRRREREEREREARLEEERRLKEAQQREQREEQRRAREREERKAWPSDGQPPPRRPAAGPTEAATRTTWSSAQLGPSALRHDPPTVRRGGGAGDGEGRKRDREGRSRERETARPSSPPASRKPPDRSVDRSVGYASGAVRSTHPSSSSSLASRGASQRRRSSRSPSRSRSPGGARHRDRSREREREREWERERRRRNDDSPRDRRTIGHVRRRSISRSRSPPGSDSDSRGSSSRRRRRSPRSHVDHRDRRR